MIDTQKMREESWLEFQLYVQLEQARLLEGLEWQRKIKNHKVDFVYHDLRIAIEVQGGTEGFGRGRGNHVREPQYSKDRRFSNEMQKEGWWVLEFSAPMINSNEALRVIRDALDRRRKGTMEQCDS